MGTYFSLDLPSKTWLLVELMLLIVDISLLILRSNKQDTCLTMGCD